MRLPARYIGSGAGRCACKQTDCARSAVSVPRDRPPLQHPWTTLGRDVTTPALSAFSTRSEARRRRRPRGNSCATTRGNGMSAALLVLPALSLTRRVAAVPHQRVVGSTQRQSTVPLGCGNTEQGSGIFMNTETAPAAADPRRGRPGRGGRMRDGARAGAEQSDRQAGSTDRRVPPIRTHGAEGRVPLLREGCGCRRSAAEREIDRPTETERETERTTAMAGLCASATRPPV